MTASEIFRLRTGVTNDSYVEMAEQIVREYLNYVDSDPLTYFAPTVGNVAAILYQRDQASANASTAGVKSESFTEGAVSVKTDYLTNADMGTSYDNVVQAELDKIRRYRIARIVKPGNPINPEPTPSGGDGIQIEET